MPMKKFVLVLALILTSGFVTCATKSVITNVRTVSLQQIEDLSLSDAWTDLTRCRYIGKEFEVRIVYHDSLTSVVFPDRRYDFMNSDDTVRLVCEETRAARLAYPAGLVLATGGISPFASDSVTGDGRYRQKYGISADLAATVFPASASTLISERGDTLNDLRLDHVRRTTRFTFVSDSLQPISQVPDSAVMTSVTDTYSLTASDEEFPRVIRRVTVLSGSDAVIAESVTYILVSAPVRSVHGRRHLVPHNRNSINPSDDGAAINVSPDGRSVTVTPSGPNEDMSMIISDISGRVFITEQIIGNDGCAIDISALPRGDYLIQLTASDRTVKILKFTNRRP